MINTYPLPIWCKNALRYYVGEPKAYPNVPEDPGAYNTLNTFFFEGTDSERARVAEGKSLNPEFLDEACDTLSLCADLMTALKYGGLNKEKEEIVYRVSRRVDVDQMLERGMTVSFTSTSKSGFLKEYTDKAHLILLQIHIAPHAPRADMAELLEDYAKPDEQEVLLPPWLPVTLESAELSTSEMAIKDRDGNPPEAKCIVKTGDSIQFKPNNPAVQGDATDIEARKRFYGTLMNHKTPAEADELAYIAWKERLLSLIHSPKMLREAFDAELVESRHITNIDYRMDDLFTKDKAEEWIMALLGVENEASFSRRISHISAPRLIHTISTYLLGCHLQGNLLLSFDKLPRIFSKKTTGGAFSFFWALACLCHDMGYYYEDTYKETQAVADDKHAETRKKMLTSEGRKELLELQTDFLELTSAQLDGLNLNKAERKWIKRSIGMIKRYNRYRIDVFKQIDHGIAGGLILFDYAMCIADPKKHAESRNPAEAADHEPQTGQMNANRTHSRFPACCLLIALTVARHNIWTANKSEAKKVKRYWAYGMRDLIISSNKDLLSMKNPLNQLLYFLEYMDTIDPIKTFYTRPMENGKDEGDLRKRFLLDDIAIRCIHHPDGWQSIDFSLGKPVFAGGEDLVDHYMRDVSGIVGWLKADKPIRNDNSAIRFQFPAMRRTRKENPYGISDEEIMDLSFYQGSGDSVRPGRFYQIPNAYQSFNLFMMKGLDGERVRIGEEKQRPYGIYIRQWRRTVKVFKSVFTAQCKYYRKSTEMLEQMYRCDRRINTDMMLEAHRTIAYTSTSIAGYLDAFSEGKKDNTYLKCTLGQKVPVADYQEILGENYAFVDEAEVLLPPFLGIKNTDIKTPGCSTVTNYEIQFGEMAFDISRIEEDREALAVRLDQTCESAAQTLDNFRDNPDKAKAAREDSCLDYVAWKAAYQKLIELELAVIWEEYR